MDIDNEGLVWRLWYWEDGQGLLRGSEMLVFWL